MCLFHQTLANWYFVCYILQETDAINSTMLLLQQTSIDASCSLVVYSLVEKNVLCSIMGGGDNTSSVFILPPSGFAILPDGHGNANHASASSSSAPAGHGRPAGCFLTATYQSVVTFNDQEDAEIFKQCWKAGLLRDKEDHGCCWGRCCCPSLKPQFYLSDNKYRDVPFGNK